MKRGYAGLPKRVENTLNRRKKGYVSTKEGIMVW